MATPSLVLFEIASDLACAGGVPLCPIVDPISDEEVRSVVNEESLRISLPRSSAAWAKIREQRIARACFSDGSFDEWRITNLIEERGQDDGLRSQILAMPPVIDLAGIPVTRTEANGLVRSAFDLPGRTIAQHLSEVLLPCLAREGITWWAAGQIDSSALFDMTYKGTNVLEACRQLAAGAKLEFRARRNGTTNYLLDFLTQIGGTTDPLYSPSGAPRLYIQYGRNLKGIRRQRTSDGQATRATGTGTETDGVPASIAKALWLITATPTTSKARLADANGGDGPIAFDDQLGGAVINGTPNNLWARKWPNGAWKEVTDSAVLNQEITTGTTHGWAVNDRIQFARSSSGEELTFLESPQDRIDYGLLHQYVDRPDLAGDVNVVPNPAMRAYAAASNGPPDGWNIIPGCGLAAANVDKETTTGRFRFGGASAKVVTSADGQGIESGYGDILPTASDPFVSGYPGFWLDTDGAAVRINLVAGVAAISISSMTRATVGDITTVTVNLSGAHNVAVGSRVELVGVTPDAYNGIKVVTAVIDADSYQFAMTSDPGAITVNGTSRKVWVFPDDLNKLLTESASKQWLERGWQGEDLNALGATVAKVRIMQHGPTGLTMYVDCAQVTQTPENRVFVEGSGPVALWQAINRFLTTSSRPGAQYDVDVLDLARLDGVRFPFTDIIAGQPTTMNDLDLGEIASRVLERSRSLLTDAVAKVTVSNRLDDVVDLMARPSRAPRLPTDPGIAGDPSVQVEIIYPPATPTQAMARLTSTPIGATIYYWLGDAGQDPPRVATTVAGAPTPTQWGTYTTPFGINRNQATDLDLWVYSVLGGRVSRAERWRVDRDTLPSVTLSLTQVSPTATAVMRATWVPDVDTADVDVYVRRVASPGAVAWPTVSGALGDVLDPTYLVRRRLSVSQDGSGTTAAGAVVAGGRSFDTTGLYGIGDWFAVIVVPYDRNNNVGARVSASLQASGTTPASFASFTATRSSDGTSCGIGSGAGFSFTWTLNNYLNATHDLKVYADWGFGEILVLTEPSPSVGIGSYTSDYKRTTGKFDPDLTVRFRAEIIRTSGSVVEGSVSADPISFTSSCL